MNLTPQEAEQEAIWDAQRYDAELRYIMRMFNPKKRAGSLANMRDWISEIERRRGRAAADLIRDDIRALVRAADTRSDLESK